jgi:hypothetical protein|tara:strand:+ start:329 stop:706 length:378 start_codon:yes stop_codon:yes gene_type:complete
MNCDICDTEIIEKPFCADAWGGDWFSTCPVCNWCSEDDVKTMINLNPTKDEIISLKVGIDKARRELHDILHRKYDSWGNRYNVPYEYNNMIQEVMDKLYSIGLSMLVEEPYEPATESVINDGDEV